MEYAEITSRKNEKIIWASSLCDKKNRDASGVFFTEGKKLLEEAILSGLTVEQLFFTKKALEQNDGLISRCTDAKLFLVTNEVFQKLSTEAAPQGIFACIKKPKASVISDDTVKDGGFIILENIQNPQNLGAVIRSACCMGAKKIVLSENCCDIYNPKTLRAAMGSVFKAEFFKAAPLTDFIKLLKDKGNRVICTSLHTDSYTLGNFVFKDSDSIVIGSEGTGISTEVLDSCGESIIIPMVEGAESLNAAAASSIIIWEMKKNYLNDRK